MNKTNMVYGLVGIKVKDSAWGKEVNNGSIIFNPQSLGYAWKKQAERDGENIFLLGNTKLTQEESFELKTGKRIVDLNQIEIEQELLKFKDVVSFGCALELENYDINIEGVNQIGYGVDKYRDFDEVNNRFKQAEILYDFTISSYNETPYTEEDYQLFKKVILKCVSNTKSKKGCTNEFALFVETKDEVRDNIDLNCMGDYIKVDIENDIVIYDLTVLSDLLSEVKDDLKSVEIYYNHKDMKIIGDIELAKYFNIKTRREIL